MTNLTNRPIQPKAVSASRPKRYVWVVCPYCEGSGVDRIGAADLRVECDVCLGDRRIRAEVIRMVRGSGPKRNGSGVKRTTADARHSKAVRERDNHQCMYPGCGKVPEAGGLHAAHYVRRRHKALRKGFSKHTGDGCCLRHDVGNALSHCWPHHRMVDADSRLLDEVFRGVFGDAHCDALREEAKKTGKRVERRTAE